MSIYATLWNLQVPTSDGFAFDPTEFVGVRAQAVPAHIGHPSEYPDGDPYADFLPPVVEYDPHDWDRAFTPRAVILIDDKTTKGSAGHGQEYVNPVLVLTGAEYEAITWVELWDRLTTAVAVRHPAGSRAGHR